MYNLFFRMPISIFLISTLTASSFSYSQEEKKSGWLREKIKQRWTKKQEARPAPEANTKPETVIEKAGDYTFAVNHGGLERFYIVHVPTAYKSQVATPLVVVLHGGGGDMSIQASPDYYKLSPKADKENFIAVYPNGYSKLKSGKFATWNAGHCCGDARDKKIDDVGFIKTIIESLSRQLNVDQKRIFATGMSNGAMMSYRLACEMPNVFRAIAAVAGTDNTAECKPAKAVSILHIHAKNDDHVLFTGGSGKSLSDKSKVTEFISVADTIQKWNALNACEKIPKRNLEKPRAFCETYSECKNNSEVQLCVTETGGHSWPGGKKVRRGQESPSEDISANDVMWDFFKNQKN